MSYLHLGSGLGHYADYHGRVAARNAVRSFFMDPSSGEGHEIEQPTPLSEYYTRMKAKCRSAAARPWLPVEPDPPVPKP